MRIVRTGGLARGLLAIVLAASGAGVVLALGLTERRRTFAIAAALGARGRQLAAFVWSEAVFVTTGGLALGAIIGWILAYEVVKILTGVFDPPPARLTIPWPYVALVATATIVAVVAACAWAVRATKHPALDIIRDL